MRHRAVDKGKEEHTSVPATPPEAPDPTPASDRAPRPDPDYVLIGHVARDRLAETDRVGGTVVYAGVAATRLGRRVGVVTAHASDFVVPLEIAEGCVVRLPGEATCTFEHRYVGGVRHLYLLAEAVPLAVSSVPAAWLAAPIIHLAPLMSEVSPALAALCQARVVGATAQGWLRRASEPDGAVVPMPHALDDVALEGFAALFLSEEDVGGDERVVDGLQRRVPIVVLTRGAHGCVLYAHGRRVEIPAYPANEVDGTGAGDVFAAAFLTHLEESADPEASARFAACAAALSVEGVGTQSIPTREQVQARV